MGLSKVLENHFKYHICKIATTMLGDVLFTKIKYRLLFKKKLNIKNPQTLNEKILWLKLFVHEDFHTIVADKYASRKWLSERFGEEYLVPLLFYTNNYKEITKENMPNVPCIVKSNNGCGTNHIIRNKEIVDYDLLQKDCKKWLGQNYYYIGQEWQYKNMKPYIIVEGLLQTKDGKVPNDYKLHFINGELQFVYCSIDREGLNYRKIYSPEWKPLDFIWITRGHSKKDYEGPDIERPATFDKMLEIGSEIAKLFKYVRVDFYDVDGKLYYGEITLHHGGGTDIIVPYSVDEYYGKKLQL